MKKMNNKGFMLTETLVVSGFVVATLVFLYTQFRTINRSYEVSFSYNNAEELYALGNLADYLRGNGLNVAGEVSTLAEERYLDITACPDNFLKETDYCNALIDSLDIKKAILTFENLDELKQRMDNDSHLSTNLKKFIKAIKYDAASSDYRIVAEFNNGTFATLKVK